MSTVRRASRDQPLLFEGAHVVANVLPRHLEGASDRRGGGGRSEMLKDPRPQRLGHG
jgi:hypothetical protein